MGNMTSENSRSFDLDLPQSTTPDTDRFLLEATEARERGIAGKTRPNESVTALEALNNIFKAFNTVAEMGSSQVEEQQEEIQDVSVENIADDSAITDQDQVQLAHVVKDEEKPEPTSQVKVITERETDPESREQVNNSNDLIRRVQNKLWFTPVYDGDEKRVEKIREIKSVLSMLDSYDDLVSHINDYIDSGNSFDSELFFLFHSIYTLDRPEKYYNEFRRSVFSNDRLVGGKGEKIDKFISSITYEFADIIR